MLTPRRRGLYRVAGGLTWTTTRWSVIVSWRPARREAWLASYTDPAGYRGWQLGRLLIIRCTVRTYRRAHEALPPELENVTDLHDRRPVPERIADYGQR
jgi:hypothetical protein